MIFSIFNNDQRLCTPVRAQSIHVDDMALFITRSMRMSSVPKNREFKINRRRSCRMSFMVKHSISSTTLSIRHLRTIFSAWLQLVSSVRTSLRTNYIQKTTSQAIFSHVRKHSSNVMSNRTLLESLLGTMYGCPSTLRSLFGSLDYLKEKILQMSNADMIESVACPHIEEIFL